MRPVVALYSTFLQRAFDQTVHDVCQNDAPVLLAVDRAGLVGEDGTSHQGMFTIPAQRMLPEPRRREPARRAGAPLAAAHGARPGPPVRAPLPARCGLRRPGARAARSCRSAGARCCARARDLLFVTFGPITMRALEVADALEARGLVRGRAQRPVREAARPPADPRPGARQAARRDVRGERGDRRLRLRGPRGVRGGAARRPGVPRASRVRLIGIPGDRFVDHGVGDRPAAAHPARRARPHRAGRARRSPSSGSRRGAVGQS